jgi:hypothetical protein
VDPTPAIIPHAPSTAKATVLPNTIETYVGRRVAAAGLAIAEALAERQDGGLQPGHAVAISSLRFTACACSCLPTGPSTRSAAYTVPRHCGRRISPLVMPMCSSTKF